MSNSESDDPKRDLRSLLEGYGAKPATDLQRKKDAQLTQYDAGTGEGLDEIRQALEKDPGNEKLQDWLAFSLYSNNEVDEAIQLYVKLTEDHSANPTYHYYLANSFAKKGFIQKAIEEWTAVIRIDPYSKMGRKAQARVEQARQLLRRVFPLRPTGGAAPQPSERIQTQPAPAPPVGPRPPQPPGPLKPGGSGRG